MLPWLPLVPSPSLAHSAAGLEILGALMLRPRTSRMGGLNEPQGREGREGGTSSDLLSFDSSSAHMGVWLRARVVFVHHVVPRVNVRARQAPPPPLSQQSNQKNAESHTHTSTRTRHKGRIERLRVQLAYGFEARTQHQLSSSWHTHARSRPPPPRRCVRRGGGGQQPISRKVIDVVVLSRGFKLFGPQRCCPSCRNQETYVRGPLGCPQVSRVVVPRLAH